MEFCCSQFGGGSGDTETTNGLVPMNRLGVTRLSYARGLAFQWSVNKKLTPRRQEVYCLSNELWAKRLLEVKSKAKYNLQKV